MLDDFDFDKESPFQPGKPVSPYYFKGRTKIVKKILRYLNKAEKVMFSIILSLEKRYG